MPEFVKAYLIEFIVANGMYVVFGVAAVAFLGAALGAIKKLLATIFAAALNAGDSVARQMTEKPKAVALAGIVAALVIPAVIGGYILSPAKVVEIPVIQTVKDYSGVAEVQAQYGEAESARATAQARAEAAERRLAAAEQARKIAEATAVQLATTLREMKPPEGFKEALHRLSNELDVTHASSIETAQVRRDFDYGKHRSYQHFQGAMPAGLVTVGPTLYHRACRICDQNHTVRVKMDELYTQQQREAQAVTAAAKQRQMGQMITAFGETKSIADWANDSLCKVPNKELAFRIKAGWEPTKAITLIGSDAMWYGQTVRNRNKEKQEANDKRRLAKAAEEEQQAEKQRLADAEKQEAAVKTPARPTLTFPTYDFRVTDRKRAEFQSQARAKKGGN